MSLWRDRQVGVVVAVGLWLWSLFFYMGECERQARLSARDDCSRRQKTLVGALEMYTLDRNLQPSAQVALGNRPITDVQADLTREGYLRESLRCPETGEPVALVVPASPRPFEFNPYCSVHSPIVGPGHPDTSMAGPVVLYSLGLYLLAVPLGLWIAILIRSHRHGSKYQRARARLIPAGYALALAAMAPPAGLLALGWRRHAIWQGLWMVIGTGVLDLPYTLVLLPAVAWTAVVRYVQESRG